LEISVLIPAYNEENKITRTIESLYKLKEVKQIIVIDDGSWDNTALVASKAGAQVIKLSANRGKGAALNEGAKYISKDWVALIDADLEETASELKKLIPPVFEGNYDMAIAVFPPAVKKGGVGLVKNLASLGLKIMTKNVFLAPLSGQRLMSKQVFLDLLPLAGGFGVEVGMTIDACLKGYRIVEVFTNMGHAETGRNWEGFLHRGKQFKDVFYTLTKKGWRKWSFF